MSDDRTREQIIEAGKNISLTYSQEGRESGLLSNIDRAEMEKLATQAGVSVEQYLIDNRVTGQDASVDARIARNAETIGGLAYADYDGDKRFIPWHLPETGQNGSQISVAFNGHSGDNLLWPMAEAAKVLDWDILKLPGMFRLPGKYGNKRVAASRPDPRIEGKMRDYFYLVRPPNDRYGWDDAITLGECRDAYTIYQNEQFIESFERLSKTGAARCETVLFFDGGQKVAAYFKLGETRFVFGDDAHELFLCYILDHSGEGAVWTGITAVRGACKNAVRLTRGNAVERRSIRHDKDVAENVDARILDMFAAEGAFDAYAADAERLAAVEIDDNQFEQIAAEVDALLTRGGKSSDSDQAKAQRATRVNSLVANWQHSNSLTGIDKNGFRAVQSINESANWNMDVRTPRSRMLNAIADNGRSTKATNKAREMVLTLGSRRIK